ncbi:mechanosensitive ion channel family protein [Halodesulfovibrio sp.]|uniref:mechanosensitive ion channel family protein n=1 Tax=Halodesulfovibrio sp. TaxID=1912772 RepID=UPI0025BFB33F|nr:mechanosensitive ion channel family protein [Halodesulfovibrio sp.]
MTRTIYQIFLSATLILLLGFQSTAYSSDMMDNPLTPPNTFTPQATLTSYLDNITKAFAILQEAFVLDMNSSRIFTHTPEVLKLQEEANLYFQKAIDCLDLSKIPEVYREEYSKEVVIQLKEILDRINLPDLGMVPAGNNLGRKEIPFWRIPKTPIEMVLITEGLRNGEYLFSAETVGKIPELYEMAKRLPYKTHDTEDFFQFYISTPGSLLPPKWFHFIPAWMSSEIYYGETPFQWLMLALSFIFLVTFVGTTYRVCSHRIDPDRPILSDFYKLTLPLLLTGLAYLLMYFLESIVNLSGATLYYTTGILDVIKWLSAAWAIVVGASLAANIFIASPNVNPQSIDASLIRTVAYLSSIFMAICVLFYGGSNLGLPLIPIVTGFGVIGLAVSLAAKPTIENIIGGLTLFADRPVRIGEYCAFENQWGKVLHIGLRSTRIRAGDRTVISIPNAIFSQMQLVNISLRDLYRFNEYIHIRQETSGTQLRWILAKIREMLVAHPEVLSKYLYRVKFDSYSEHAQTVRVCTFINGNLGWEEYLDVRQDLLFRIGEIIREAGTDLAYPSQTIYLARDKKSLAPTESVLNDMKQNDTEYPYPNTSEQRYDELLDRLKYPPTSEEDFEGLPLEEKKEDLPETSEEDEDDKKETVKVMSR